MKLRNKAAKSGSSLPPCSRRRVRLTLEQMSLLRMCFDHPSKRMWVWKSRPEYHRRAVSLLRKGLIEREADPEIYRITAQGICVANEKVTGHRPERK